MGLSQSIGTNHIDCYQAKVAQDFININPTPSHQTIWTAARKLAFHAKNHRNRYTEAASFKEPIPTEPSQQEFVKEWSILLTDPGTGEGPLKGLNLEL